MAKSSPERKHAAENLLYLQGNYYTVNTNCVNDSMTSADNLFKNKIDVR